MMFALNAQMNGSFSSTLSKAQQEFARLGKEIQGLSKIQSDISAYQKQQGAIDATQTKLNNLQQQETLLVQQLKATKNATEQDTAAIAALEREKLKLEQQISNTNAALERQSQKLSDTGARLKEAGIDTANLSQQDAELTARIKDLQAEQDKAADGAASFGERSVQAIGAVQQALVAAGIAAALKSIADAYMECVGIAGDFEAGMSNVEALSGATAAEMEQLSGVAKELGATTKFTALQSADAMGYMAMAGWDAVDMMNGMDGVMQLAAASGEDLAMVSDIVTDSLTAFGLTAADTARFSDVLAAAATNSNTNVSIMGETFKQSASIAGALGYSIEDMAVAVGLMANAGVKGSIAGTALKNTFNGLLKGATLTGAAFGEYEYSAVKADGTMKSFSSTINELRVYFDQMTEAERVNNAMTIAGARGYNGLLAILNATDEDYASLTDSINNCSGAAQRMAAIKLDNMNGQLTLMNSAWEALRTTVGEQFIPEMRGLYEIGTDVFTILNDFVRENPALVKAVAAFVAVIGVATAGLTAYAAIAKVVAALNLASLFATAGPILLAVGAVAALTAGIAALANAGSEEEKELRSLTAASREQHAQLQELNAQYEEAKAQYGETSDEALALRYEVDQLTDAYEANKQTLDDFIAENDALIESHNKVMASFSETTNSIGDEEQGALALALKLGELTSKTTLTENEQKQLLAVVDALNKSVPDLALNFDTAKNSINMSADAVKAAIKAQAQQEREAEKYRTWVDLTKEELALDEQLAEATENLRLRKEELTAEGYNTNAPLIGWSTDLDDYEAEVERLTAAYNENQAALAELDQKQENVADGSSAELQSIIESTTEQAAALTEAYNSAYEAALESMQGQYALWDQVAPAVATSAGSINDAIESQITYWKDYNANLKSLTERSSDIEGLSEVIASFSDGSQGSVKTIAGLAGATDEELQEIILNYQTLQREQKGAAGSLADLKTDFTDTMDQMQKDLKDDISAMDLSVEAAESGRATIQGYIDGLNDMHPEVQAAFARLAQALPPAPATAALPKNGFAPIASLHGRGYATGTESAEPGFALVGEKGPELIYFNGGEKVVNAAQTAAMRSQPAISALVAPVSGANSPVTIQVSFNIQGTASPETVASLQEFGSEFAEHVLDVIEQHNIDVARRAYR